jgi:hypothetical protein
MECFSQSFYTGAIGVTQSNGGRTRVFADNLTTRQFDRLSILVGVSSTQVFDYNQDQDVLIPAATVVSPYMSDFEVTSTINNTYSNLPPNVEVAINLYGWNNGAYILAKMNVKNNEASAINAVIGLEAIPQIGGTYENDILQWDAASSSVLINEGSWSALKFFSGTQTSAEFIDWVSGYANDSLYYHWLTQNSFDSPLTTTADGGVAILGQNPVSLDPGASADFYFGIAIGADQTTCLNNMDLCASQYNQIVPVELTSFTAVSQNRQVTLNWATATEINNNGFEVQRSIANSEFVTIGFVRGNGTTTTASEYTYIDKNLLDASYSYRLKQIDYNGNYEYSDAVEVEVRSLDSYSLEQNYPNPFNPVTKIGYVISEKTNVKVTIMNALGEEIALLANETQDQGFHQLEFNGTNLPSGIYFYSLQAGNFTETKKMMLMK